MATITRATDREREQMRRSALGSTQGPTDEQQAHGGIPPNFYRIDPQDPTSVSFPFLRRMSRDHMLAMGLHFIESDVLSSPWWFDGDDARVQAYADKLIRPIYVDLATAALQFLRFGYSDGVKNFTTARPNWTYYEDGKAKKVWDNGPIDAVIYSEIIPLEPEVSQLSWDSAGRFNGIQYDHRYGPVSGTGTFIINGQRTPNIDKMHAWWITHGKMAEGGNPYGFARIAHAAPIFWMFRWIWDLVARGFENSFDPGPVVRFPREDAPTLNDDGAREDNVQAALRIGSRRRTGSTIALPSDQHKDLQEKMTGVYKWAIEYPKADTNFDAVMEFITYLEAAKLHSLFSPEQSLTEGRGGSSSRNVAENFSDQRSTSQNILLNQIHGFITDVFVKPVIQIMFPLYEGELEMKSMGAGGQATDLLRQVFQLTGQQDFARFGIDMRRLAEANKFPMLDPAEQQKDLERKAQQANVMTPPVEPTQGRRALVTQTGFGEMNYHQIEQRRAPIEFLSRDGDFVAGLPHIDAFADATVVANARDLRRACERLMTWAGRDLARHVARSHVLSDPGKIVWSWVPDFEVLDEHWRPARSAIFDVVARAADLTMPDHGAIDSSHWVDRLMADSLHPTMNQLREQASEVVASSYEQGADARTTGQAVRTALELTAQTYASSIAQIDAQRAYNHGVLSAGVGRVKFAQIIDRCTGHERRNGEIKDVQSMLLSPTVDPGCTMTVRLLPGAPDGLTKRTEILQDDLAMYDEDTETVLVDPSVKPDAEAEFMLALGEKFI